MSLYHVPPYYETYEADKQSVRKKGLEYYKNVVCNRKTAENQLYQVAQIRTN